MKTSDFLRQHNACPGGAEWALSISKDMADVWEAMIEQGKHEWLIWAATRQGVFTESILRKLACRFVRETPLADGHTVWDLLTDERSRSAIEVAEAFANGKATKAELVDAHSAARAASATTWDADAAARAAYYAAYSAAADAAWDAAYSAHAASGAANAARAAQARMIAGLGNPFKEES